MKPRNLYRITIGAVMIASGILSILLNAGDAIISAMLLAAGFAFLITGISQHFRYGDEPESDERSKKIGAYAITYAWLTGLFFMVGLFWLDYLGVLRLGSQNALALSVVVLTLSAVICQTYLFRKGDVE